MRELLIAILLVSHLQLGNGIASAEDLGIVRVITPAKPGRPSGSFTATHLGRGILLTCGHCCRYAGGPGSGVKVEILSAEKRTATRMEAGAILCLDDSADVGVIRLDPTAVLSVAYRLAPRDYRVAPFTPVIQYTWGEPGGRTLHSVRSRISAVNQFVGPANLETSQAPVQGDSGAPLVSLNDGFIIGVTTGADPWGRFGVHAGTTAIHDLLDRCRVNVPDVVPASAEKSVTP